MTPSSSDQPSPETPSDEMLGRVSDHGLRTVSPLNLALLLLAIGSIAAALYLSPSAAPLRAQVKEGVSETLGSVRPSADEPTPAAGATPSTSPTTAAPATLTSAQLVAALSRPGGSGGGADGTGSALAAAALRGPALEGPSLQAPAAAPTTAAGATPRPSASSPSATPSPTPTRTPAKPTRCWEFTWQQDAQVVYVANLSDPYGLDGIIGPNDADGIACSDLPVDPARPASTPAGAYVAPRPSAATKAAIVHPALDWWGVSQDGVPGDGAILDDLARSAGKAPSSVGWYSTFDSAYRGDLVTAAWRRGALPVMTLMPTAAADSEAHHSLSTIIRGADDAYLKRFAGDVVRADLPVVIRFGHEMNGRWYGWSSGRTDYNNSPEKYVEAWRHVWQVFEDVGANDNVVWLWSPSRIDTLRPSGTNGITDMAASYPGDAYVDWVGASVYLRHADTGPTFAASFGKTIDALTRVTDKPMFFAEVGAIETSGTTAVSELKAEWIRGTLSTFADSERVVGFLWNNNIVSAVEGNAVTNDWRFGSSAPALEQFRTQVARPQFRSGTHLD